MATHTAGLFGIVARTYIYIGFVSQNSDEAYVHVRNRHVLLFYEASPGIFAVQPARKYGCADMERGGCRARTMFS